MGGGAARGAAVAAVALLIGSAAAGWSGALLALAAPAAASDEDSRRRAVRPAAPGSASASPVRSWQVASAGPAAGRPEEAGRVPDAPPAGAAPPPPPGAPTFDLVRIEPAGESVIAGRGPGGAMVEMLRNGEVYARVMADVTGLFALVSPPLPAGTHEIVLQTVAPNGTRARSRESVTIKVVAGAGTKPFVALTSPDKPTVVLSAPDPAPARAPGPEPDPEARGKAGRPAGSRPGVRVVSVEAEDNGRLMVSGQAAAGATVRLSIDEASIAPGSAGNDGRVSFTIGGGVKPGRIRIRLDDVDPVTGEVKSSAEVPFTVPPAVAVPLPPEADPLVTGSRVAVLPTPEGADAAAPSTTRPRRTDAPAAGEAAPDAPDQASRSEAAQGRSGEGASSEVADPDLTRLRVPEVNTAIVSRGDSLWRISKRVYGRGTRYTVIYDANHRQIRDPELLQPGQVVILPEAPRE